MNVPLMYNFRSLSNKFPTIFGSLIFTFHFLVRLFFAEKWKPKIFGLKNAMEREIRKKNFFRPVWPQSGLKIRGGAQNPWAPPLDLLLIMFPTDYLSIIPRARMGSESLTQRS